MRVEPYLFFDGRCEEAIEFYKKTLGAQVVMLMRFKDSPEPQGPQCAPGNADKIMHAMLETGNGFTLMGADTPTGMKYDSGKRISISLSGDDGDQLRGYWEKLSAGGTISMPLEKQMWGDEFGMCTDRYGVDWLVNIGQQQT